MQIFTTTLALAFASSVSAHALMYGVSVNGVDRGDGRGVYIRSPPDNSPVKDLASPNLVCGPNGGKAVGSFVRAAAGDQLTFEWYHNTRNDDIIDGSHKGPIITYIAPYTSGSGTGAIWSKIAQDGFSNGQWAVDKLRANNGKNTFTLPANLAAGKYIIRQEIIALHEADTAFNANSARGAQFYPSCVQVEVTGSGSAVPSQNFNINSGYTYQTPGIVFNLYGSFSSYPIPGPAIFNFAGGSSGASKPTTTTTRAAIATSTSAVVVRPTSTRATSVVVVRPTTTSTARASTLTTAIRRTSTSAQAATRPTQACAARGKARTGN